jgi:hypothetical protein
MFADGIGADSGVRGGEGGNEDQPNRKDHFNLFDPWAGEEAQKPIEMKSIRDPWNCGEHAERDVQ